MNEYGNTALRYDIFNRPKPGELRFYRKYMGRKASVLEVGCGTGKIALELHRKAPNVEFTCIDLSPEMLGLFREKLDRIRRAVSREGRGGISLVQADMRTWNPPGAAPEGGFDLILFPGESIQVLGKEDIPAVLERYAGMLRPRGRLVLTAFDPRVNTRKDARERLVGTVVAADGIYHSYDEIESLDDDTYRYRMVVKRYDPKGNLLDTTADDFRISVIDDAWLAGVLGKSRLEAEAWYSGFSRSDDSGREDYSVVVLRARR